MCVAVGALVGAPVGALVGAVVATAPGMVAGGTWLQVRTLGDCGGAVSGHQLCPHPGVPPHGPTCAITHVWHARGPSACVDIRIGLVIILNYKLISTFRF